MFLMALLAFPPPLQRNCGCILFTYLFYICATFEFLYVTIILVIVILYTQEICSKYGVVAYTDIKEGESEVHVCCVLALSLYWGCTCT